MADMFSRFELTPDQIYDSHICGLALRLHKTPAEIEAMPYVHVAKMLEYIEAADFIQERRSRRH